MSRIKLLVMDVVHYICPHDGGRGAVRELIEYMAAMEA